MDGYYSTAIQQYFSVYHSDLISHTKVLGSNNLIKKTISCFLCYYSSFCKLSYDRKH